MPRRRKLNPEQWEERKEGIRDEMNEYIAWWQREHPDAFPQLFHAFARAEFPHWTEDERAIAFKVWQERLEEWKGSR